jgi:hypothetical protein
MTTIDPSQSVPSVSAEQPAVLRQADFAAWLGCSKSYVTRLKTAGRLVMTPDGLVDVAASMARLAATRGERFDVERRWADSRGQIVTTNPLPAPAAAPASAPAAAPAALPAADPADPADDDGPLDVDTIGLRTRLAAMRKAEADARMAHRRDEIDAGAWLARADVERDLVTAVGVLLNALDGIPDRVAPLLVGIDAPDRVRAVLRDELEQYIARVHRQLTTVASRATGAA